VGFNENLASFVAEKMKLKYLKLRPTEMSEYLEQRRKVKGLGQLIVAQTKLLNKRYENLKTGHEKELQIFLATEFMPKIKAYCQELSLNYCWPIKEKWNNARFAALGTYSNKQDRLEKIYKTSGLSLQDFIQKIIKLETNFNGESEFLQFLEQKL
jgi:GTP-binding protein EngB required for normal cell division